MSYLERKQNGVLRKAADKKLYLYKPILKEANKQLQAHVHKIAHRKTQQQYEYQLQDSQLLYYFIEIKKKQKKKPTCTVGVTG